jgi:hypothetical protein
VVEVLSSQPLLMRRLAACCCPASGRALSAPPRPRRAGKGKPGEERKGLAILRNIHMSPKKLGLWAKMVRRLHVEDAMIQCTIRVNKGAKILAQARACWPPAHPLSLHSDGFVTAGCACGRSSLCCGRLLCSRMLSHMQRGTNFRRLSSIWSCNLQQSHTL